MVTKTTTKLEQAVDIASLISQQNFNLSDTEFDSRLAELAQCLANVRQEFDAMSHRVDEKEGQITKLESQLSVAASLEWKKPFYYRHTADGREGPFCQHCWDEQKHLAQLSKMDEDEKYSCPDCGGHYQAEPCRVTHLKVVKRVAPEPRQWTPY